MDKISVTEFAGRMRFKKRIDLADVQRLQREILPGHPLSRPCRSPYCARPRRGPRRCVVERVSRRGSC
jgi:hypothetical protein